MRAALRLAAQTNCTLAELGERMSAQEFGLWSVFLENEPLGPAALLGMFAEIMAMLANGPLKAPEGRKVWRATDFMDAERWKPPQPEQAVAEPSVKDVIALFQPR